MARTRGPARSPKTWCRSIPSARNRPEPPGPRTSGGPDPTEVLPDVLGPGLAIVFCGSAAGRVSARRGAYYAGPGNRFWPTLAKVGLTPRRLAPEEFRRLPEFGLGLTDLNKRAQGADADLPPGLDDPAALDAKIRRFQPAILAFVGKRPARVFLGRVPGYGPQPERLGRTRVFVLPSPSGAARRYWDEGWWRALGAAADLRSGLSAGGSGPRDPSA